MQHPMMKTFSKANWQAKRAANMQAARDCLDTLLAQGRSRDEEKVQKALQFWVSRARRSHAIAMGREPIIPNFVFITDTGAATFPLNAA